MVDPSEPSGSPERTARFIVFVAQASWPVLPKNTVSPRSTGQEACATKIGKLAFRTMDGHVSEHNTLLRACGLLFLFRALAMGRNEDYRAKIEAQIEELIVDLVPCQAAAVQIGDDGPEKPDPPDTCRIELPLMVGEAAAGTLIAWISPERAVNVTSSRDTLSAIATLASAALESANEVRRLQYENELLRERLNDAKSDIVGESFAIHKLLRMIARVAPQSTSVLILGESGTGKELVAHAVHRLSPRVAKPFVAINCAALTDTLLESELFGHERGAFTGAVAQKKGKLELAEGGTVFLDEIGELAQTLQAKLLRVLQEREFERVGGTRTLRLDVRLIAATNRDLAAEVKRGAFREDLYHRLNVVALRVPPLRERAEDILPLARYFLDRAALRCGRRVDAISPEAERYLAAHSWPGNVRELENAIEHAVVLGESNMILPEDLPETVFETAAVTAVPGALQASVTHTKRDLIVAAWRQCGGDHNRTASVLNLHPNSLRRLIRNLGLRETLAVRD